jgi:hypothetical protein
MLPLKGSASSLPSDFDGFLFAPIDENSGNSGMPLSVLSALARRDVDPWEEAARLTCLPREAAIQRLSALIVVLPDGASTHSDPEAIAARLIALLPHGAGSVIHSRTERPSVRTASHAWLVKCVIVYWIIALFVLGAQLFVASHPVVTRAATAAMPMSGPVVSQAPPRNADPRRK